jgi:hypothetical protein
MFFFYLFYIFCFLFVIFFPLVHSYLHLSKKIMCREHPLYLHNLLLYTKPIHFLYAVLSTLHVTIHLSSAQFNCLLSTVPYCTVPHCTAQYCTLQHCTEPSVLHCILHLTLQLYFALFVRLLSFHLTTLICTIFRATSFTVSYYH